MNNTILFSRKYKVDNVQFKFEEVSNRKQSEALEDKCKTEWQIMLENAEKEGKKVWDQDVFRLESFNVDTNVNLNFSTIPFSVRYAMNKFTDDVLALGQEYYPMACDSAIFVKTADGKYVFIQKSDKLLSRRKFSFIGGVFNRAKDKTFSENNELFNSAITEINEELGIQLSIDNNLELRGAFINQTCNVCFVFEHTLELTEEQIQESFAKNHDEEVESLIFVEPNNLEDFVTNTVGINKIITDVYKQS